MLSVGSVAPDFSLVGSDGKNHSLSDYKGKNVILYFYPKDDTPGCTIEAKEFTMSSETVEQKNAVVLGVSHDTVDSHNKFKEKYNLDFLLLSDPEYKVVKLYECYGNKGVFGMGTLRRTYIIDKDGMISKVFDKVTPRGHSGEVLSCIV
jgi:peroxiredoxin Q/BCP